MDTANFVPPSRSIVIAVSFHSIDAGVTVKPGFVVEAPFERAVSTANVPFSNASTNVAAKETH